MSWADVPFARRWWADAPKVDATLQELLEIAHDPLVKYAPTLADGAPVPESYRFAEVLHARNLWGATRRDGDVIGFDDGAAMRVRPLDPVVKSLLRPGAGIGRVG